MIDRLKTSDERSLQFPLTAWQKKVLSVGLRNEQPPNYKINLLRLLRDMGRSCRMTGKYSAAEVLLLYGLDQGRAREEDGKGSCKSSVADCWEELAKVYDALGKSEEAERCRQERQRCRSTAGGISGVVENVDQQLGVIRQLVQDKASGRDTEELKAEAAKLSENYVRTISSLAEGNLPAELGEELAPILKPVLEKMQPIFTAVQESITFQKAKNLIDKGDLDGAKELILSGLARITSDDWVSAVVRIKGLNQLALIEKAKSNAEEALRIFAESMQLAQPGLLLHREYSGD